MDTNKRMAEMVFERNNIDYRYMESFKNIQPYISSIVKRELSYMSDYSDMVRMLEAKLKDVSRDQKEQLIDLISDGYYNTNLDEVVYMKEYKKVIESILLGSIPLKLEHMCIEELYDDMYKIISNN